MTVQLQIGADGRTYEPLARTVVTLTRAVVTLTSARGDVLTDTITPQGSRLSREPAYLNESPLHPQELLLRYELRPSARWDIEVEVLDGNDSVRYAGTSYVEDMDAFEYLDGCLPVEPRYAVMEGRFRLPEAIEADGIPTSARARRALFITRLDLLVDDALITERRPYDGPAAPGDERFMLADSGTLAGASGVRFFRPVYGPGDPPLVVTHEYGSVFNHEFTVSAYGYVEGDTVGRTPERLLFEGTKDMDLSQAKVAAEEDVVMEWKAVDAIPVDIRTGFDVRLGRAGKVVVNVIIPAAVDI